MDLGLGWDSSESKNVRDTRHRGTGLFLTRVQVGTPNKAETSFTDGTNSRESLTLLDPTCQETTSDRQGEVSETVKL